MKNGKIFHLQYDIQFDISCIYFVQFFSLRCKTLSFLRIHKTLKNSKISMHWLMNIVCLIQYSHSSYENANKYYIKQVLKISEKILKIGESIEDRFIGH